MNTSETIDPEALAELVIQTIQRAVARLEKRIAELEARPTARDAGVWRSGTAYTAGDIVSHGGSGWICRSGHTAIGTEPSHTDFRLFVKCGKDGRDLR